MICTTLGFLKRPVAVSECAGRRRCSWSRDRSPFLSLETLPSEKNPGNTSTSTIAQLEVFLSLLLCCRRIGQIVVASNQISTMKACSDISVGADAD